MLRGVWNKKTKTIATKVLANVKANFDLKGFKDLDCVEWQDDEQKHLIFKCESHGNNPHFQRFTFTNNNFIKEREELLIMDLSYKLLVWLNDLTFDNRYKEYYND